MANEEKQLLLKDLCARLPYGVLFMVHDDEINEPVELLSINPKRVKPLEIDDGHDENSSTYWNFEDVKPYLRPMSSMTEEENREVREFGVSYDGAFHNDVYDVGISMEEAFTAISWFLERHFDINYLIQKGLALEAPEGMYKTE